MVSRTTLASAAVIALFCTGLVEPSLNISSTIVLFAPSSMPFSFFLSNADMRPATCSVASVRSALLLRASNNAALATGLWLMGSRASMTVVLLAPSAMPSSFVLSSADIRPLAVWEATSVTTAFFIAHLWPLTTIPFPSSLPSSAGTGSSPADTVTLQPSCHIEQIAIARPTVPNKLAS